MAEKFGHQEIWSPRYLGPKKFELQKTLSQHENQYNQLIFMQGHNFLGVIFLGAQKS